MSAARAVEFSLVMALVLGACAPGDEEFVREYVASVVRDGAFHKQYLSSQEPVDAQLAKFEDARSQITDTFEILRWDRSWATPDQCYLRFSNGRSAVVYIGFRFWRVREAGIHVFREEPDRRLDEVQSESP